MSKATESAMLGVFTLMCLIASVAAGFIGEWTGVIAQVGIWFLVIVFSMVVSR